MTALDTALAGSDISNAKGPTTIKRYLFPVANAVVATALINQSAFSFPVAALTVDTVSGTWGSIRAGMTVFVGTAPGLNDVGIYRVRPDTISSTHLPIAETSQGDPGLFPPGLRTGTFNDDQYITIIANSNFYSIIPLITGGSVFEDYNRTAGNNNTNPAPLVYVVAGNKHNHVAQEVDAGAAFATIQFTASYDLWPTSSSAAYLWDPPASWPAPSAGSVSAASVTFQVPRNGIVNDVLNLYVTEDSVAQFQQRTINVWVYEKTGAYAPLMISDISSDQWDDNLGYSASLTLNDTLVASIPDGAMVMIKDAVTYNGSAITSAADQFVGWLVRSTKHGEPGLRSAEVEFVSPAGLLNLRRGMSQIWGLTFSGWEYAPATLLSLSYAMHWLLRNRARGVLENFDVNLYSTAPTGQRLPQIEVNAAPLWQQLTNLADGISKRQISCDPDGTIWVRQNPSLVIYSSRSAIIKRDSLDASLLHDYQAPREYVPQVGWLQGEAFTWDGVSATATPLLAIAPGSAPGQGAQDQTLQGQVVASQNDIDILTGYYYAMLNPDYSQITINIQSNRAALYKPAQRQMVRLQIPAAYMADGVAFDRYIIPRQIRRTFTKTNEGIVVDTQIIADVETAGSSAETRPVPAANNNLYGGQTVITPPVTNGNSARNLYGVWANIGAISADGNIYRTANFTSTSPTWTQTSLGVTGAPVAGVGNPFSPRYASGTVGGEVDDYIATDTTGIYLVKNCQGSPAATLQKTFRGTTVLRSLNIQFGSRYTIVCRSVYSDGVYVTYSTDGSTWSAETLDGDATTASYMSGVFVSTHSIGRVYGSSLVSAVGKGRGSTNSGATFATLSSPDIETGIDLAGDIHVPFASNPSDLIAYYGKQTGSGSVTLPTTLDFSVSDYGFAPSGVAPIGSCGPPIGAGITGGSYAGGTGFNTTGGSPTNPAVWITLDLSSPISITSFSFTISTVPTSGGVGFNGQLYVYIPGSGGWQCGLVGATGNLEGTHVNSGTGIASYSGVTKIGFLLYGSSATTETAVLEKLILGGSGAIGSPARLFMSSNGASIVDLSPIVSSVSYGPWQSRQIDSCPINRNYMGLAAGNNDQSLAGLWTSNTAGASWTQLVAPTGSASRYERIAVSGNGPIYYVFGKQGSIGVSTDGATVSSRVGNIGTFSPGAIINIMGL